MRGKTQALNIPLSHAREEVRLARLRVLVRLRTFSQRVARQGFATDNSSLPPDASIAWKRQDTLHRSPRIKEAQGVFWQFRGGVGVADALVGSVFGQRCNRVSPENVFPDEIRATMWRAETRRVQTCQGETAQSHFLAVAETGTDGSRKCAASTILALPLDFQTRDSRLIAQLGRLALVDGELHPKVPGSG